MMSYHDDASLTISSRLHGRFTEELFSKIVKNLFRLYIVYISIELKFNKKRQNCQIIMIRNVVATGMSNCNSNVGAFITLKNIAGLSTLM